MTTVEGAIDASTVQVVGSIAITSTHFSDSAGSPTSADDVAVAGPFGIFDPTTLATATGCASCGQTGYAGRSGIYELVVADEAVERLIHDGADEGSLRRLVRSAGARSLREDGLRLLASGETSAEELLRVTRD